MHIETPPLAEPRAESSGRTSSGLLKDCSQALADLAQAVVLDRPDLTRFITHQLQPALAELVKRSEAIDSQLEKVPTVRNY